jgi:hypothetical protein
MTITQTRFIVTSLILFGLAACQPETIDPNKADREEAAQAAANAASVKPMPMIASSKIYRCDDSSVVTVDFMTDGVTANIRATEGAMPKHLTAAEKGKPFTGDGGYSLEGNGSTVKLATGGKAQTCRAG